MRSIKSRLKCIPHREQIKDAGISGLLVSLEILKDTATNVGIPGLSVGIGSLSFLIKKLQTTRQNSEDIENLSNHVRTLTIVISQSVSPRKEPESQSLQLRAHRLSKTWKDLEDQFRSLESRSRISKFFHSEADAITVKSLTQAIAWSIQSFLIEETIAIESKLDEHGRLGTENAMRLERQLGSLHKNIHQLQTINHMNDASTLLCAANARFDCTNRATSCLEGTRTEVLDQIYKWIDEGTSEALQKERLDIQGNPVAFWVNGLAGTGKTTIAYTVAHRCYSQDILGASFFCSRDSGECSNPMFLFNTLSYQLGLFYQPFQEAVSRSLRTDPLLVYSNVSHQLEELVIKPLHSLKGDFPACLIVIDALDECRDEPGTSAILSALSQRIADLHPIRFLITSRPEQNMTSGFAMMGSAIQHLHLHEVALDTVERDIEHYVRTSLRQIADRYHIDYSWPAPQEILDLTKLSSGLFLFASTAVRFVEDKNYSAPTEQLKHVLCSKTYGSSSPHQFLDKLYAQVLNNAFPVISPSLAGRLKTILGSIILFQDPMSPSSLEQLLELPCNTVRTTLLHLNSVIVVPTSNDGVIRIIHPTFTDFLMDSQNSPASLEIDPSHHHTLILHCCLKAMMSLRKDMCHIQDPTKLNAEIPDLEERVKRYIPLHVQYACRHWGFHLSLGPVSEVTLGLLTEFFSTRLLYWLEVCSLLGILNSALKTLDMTKRVLSTHYRPDTMALLSDCEKFIVAFLPCISIASLHIYHSALPFTPTNSPLRRLYYEQMENSAKISEGEQAQWSECLQTIEQPRLVNSISLSSDGTRLVSSYLGTSISLWDLLASTELQVFRGHENGVCTVSFSPDDTRILSGSLDTTARIWDIVSGACVLILEHPFPVISACYSPKGEYVISGGWSTSFCLWEVSNGVNLRTFKGHLGHITSLAFSPDHSHIASASKDETIRLWNTTGAHALTLEGHSDTVAAVAFSPDGAILASGSSDRTIRLWDSLTGARIRILAGHAGTVYSTAFSADNIYIISGSEDKTVRVWDAFVGTLLQVFRGHTGQVRSIAISPDGAHVASGAFDKTVRIWDITQIRSPTASLPQTTSVALSSDGHYMVSAFNNTIEIRHALKSLKLISGQHITSLAFSPDGNHFLAIADDASVVLRCSSNGQNLHKFLELAFDPRGSLDLRPTTLPSQDWKQSVTSWEDVTCCQPFTFRGHSAPIVFSCDGSRLVTGSEGNHPKVSHNVARLWDTASGNCLHVLEGHDGFVVSVAFSYDGTRVLSGSDDTTVQLWDAITGTHIRTFEGHSGGVYSVAFSKNATLIASGSKDRTGRVWDSVTGDHLQTFKGHTHEVWSVSFTVDDHHVLSGSKDRTIRLWDLSTGSQLHLFDRNLDWVQTTTFSSDGTGILAGPEKKMVHLWSSGDTSPLKRSWPIYKLEDEWIVSVTPNRKERIIWLPAEYRSWKKFYQSRVILGHLHGGTIELDLNLISKY